MTTVPLAVPSGGLRNGLVRRQLNRYPRSASRYGYLAIVVLTTITLYYLYYVEGAVLPLLLPSYHMSFLYFLYIIVVVERYRRVHGFHRRAVRQDRASQPHHLRNAPVGLVQLIAVPNIHSKFLFGVAYSVIGFAEGIILVSTPALMRDFSPQVGRGAAMGFWALGPTMGALAASLVATHTLPHLGPWQDQFIISGTRLPGGGRDLVRIPARTVSAAAGSDHGVRARTGTRRGARNGHRYR